MTPTIAPPMKPPPPPAPVKHGKFCIKVVSQVVGPNAKPQEKYTGYDTDYNIVKRVQTACVERKGMNCKCLEPEVTLLPGRCGHECCGEVYWELGTMKRRISA